MSAIKDCVLCVDIGSTSLKAALMADDCSVYAYSRQIFNNYGSEYAAAEWIDALSLAVKDIQNQNENAAIEAICISGNGPTICSINGKTALWNTEQVVATDTKSLFIPQLLTYKKLYPQEWDSSPVIYSGPEYLIYQLTGKSLTILPEERYIQAYWSEEELKRCGFTDNDIKKLPPFVKPASLAGQITKEAAIKTGLLQGTLVITGAPDFIAALVGTNTITPGAMCDRAGSSEGINLCTAKPLVAPGIRTLPSIKSGLWNASVLIPDAGIKFANYKAKIETLKNTKITYTELVDAIFDHKKHCPTCLMSDQLADEGVKIMEDNALEVSKAVALLKYEAKKAGIEIPYNMTLTGGQGLNPQWVQMKSNTSDIPINLTWFSDAELIGDLIFARIALGDYDDYDEAAFVLGRIKKTFYPHK